MGLPKGARLTGRVYKFPVAPGSNRCFRIQILSEGFFPDNYRQELIFPGWERPGACQRLGNLEPPLPYLDNLPSLRG